MKKTLLKNSKEVWGFSFYDFANSAYLLIFGTLLFPIFFKETLFVDNNTGDFYWGILISVSVLCSTLISPFIGYFSDIFNRKKLFSTVVFIVFLGATGVSFLVKTNETTPLIIGGLFIIMHTFYILSITLYDAYISYVSDRENRGLASAFSWGFGYIGGSICFIIIFLLAGKTIAPSFQSFIFTAVFYLFFSIISLLLLPKSGGSKQLRKIGYPLKEIINQKSFVLLLSFWLINEAIVTITFFTALFGRGTLQLDISTIGILFLVVQLVAFPATWFMGYLSKKYSQEFIIKLTVIIWAIILIGLSVSQNLTHLIILSLISAFVIGSTQALMRAYYSSLYSKEISGSAFGIYSIITRSSAIAGPVIFGLISSVFQSQRLAIAVILIPLTFGYLLFNHHTKKILIVKI